MVTSAWCPIVDLPEDWEDLARPDLQGGSSATGTRSGSTSLESGRVRQVEERLAMRWAIETGAVERLYTIDQETTGSLVSPSRSA